MRPAQDPVRIEGIITSGSTMDQRQKYVVIKIGRQKELMFSGEVMCTPFIVDDLDHFHNGVLARFCVSYAEVFVKRKGSGI
ncbi:MAG TPA: hypothetical protein P5280_01255 [Cyclobacteriaceae bacterium]|nr:hypothetical protein [Cyclobacteriaceae bacterium]